MAGKGSGQRRCLRLDRADRGAIERGLDEALMDALGVEEVPCEECLLDMAVLDHFRAERGLAPLA